MCSSQGWQASGSVKQELQGTSPSKMGSPRLLGAFTQTAASLLAWSAAAASDETAAFSSPFISQPICKLHQLNKVVSSLLAIPGPSQPARHSGAAPLQQVSENSLTDHRVRGVMERGHLSRLHESTAPRPIQHTRQEEQPASLPLLQQEQQQQQQQQQEQH